MKIKTLVVPPIGTNCYIITNDRNEAAIIDPGGDAHKILQVIENAGCKPKIIIITHGHFDHVGAIGEIVSKYDIPVYIHRDDHEFLKMAPVIQKQYGFGSIIQPVATNFFDDDTQLDIIGYKANILHTPGHSKGCICVYFPGDKVLFSGDTLFRLSVGRTDLDGGNFNDLEKSIRNKLYTLPDNVTIYPGHGETTSIGDEKQRNPYVKI